MLSTLKAMIVEIAVRVLSRWGKDLWQDFVDWNDQVKRDEAQGELSEKNAKKYRKAKTRAEKLEAARDLLNGLDTGPDDDSSDKLPDNS